MLAWKSSIPGIAWPALPSPQGAALLALQFQLQQSERLSAADLEALQFRQLREVVTHAMRTIPWQRERLAGRPGLSPDRDIAPEAFRRLPLTIRRNVQSAGNALLSTAVPPDHGRPVKYRTGGSTGEPVHITGTELNRFFWLGLTLRDHLWHRRDFTGTLCAIRSRVEDTVLPAGGPPRTTWYRQAPARYSTSRPTPAGSLNGCSSRRARYLLTHPVNVRALAHHALRYGIRLPHLKEVRTFGETVDDDLRALCREAWNVPLTDNYSAEETGYLAFQCPEHGRYHVQAENVIVELLDDAGAALCARDDRPRGGDTAAQFRDAALPLRTRRLRGGRRTLSLRPAACRSSRASWAAAGTCSCCPAAGATSRARPSSVSRASPPSSRSS